MTFHDFKKAYNSVDHVTLINIFREFGVDDKSLTLIQQILTDAYTQVLMDTQKHWVNAQKHLR